MECQIQVTNNNSVVFEPMKKLFSIQTPKVYKIELPSWPLE